MGLAAGSIGAITPSTEQYAADESVAGVHVGPATATFDTGSPIAPTGSAVPSLADVQSASVIVLRSPISGSGATVGALWALAWKAWEPDKPIASSSEAAATFASEFMGMSMAQG
jgi:hypothetical protein